MKYYAIFGNPVSHSKSPLLYNTLFNYAKMESSYGRFLLNDGKKLRHYFLLLGLEGANITVPYKEEAFLQCDEIRGVAQKIGAVNTIVKEGNRLIGYNTDALGFYHAIRPYCEPQNILLLGAGGTSRSLAIQFQELGRKVTVLNRSKNRLEWFHHHNIDAYTYDEPLSSSYDLIVNTTSAGLTDNSLPMDESLLQHYCFNANYLVDVNYVQTPFLTLAHTLNKPFQNGKNMLIEQAILAASYYTALPESTIREVLSTIL